MNVHYLLLILAHLQINSGSDIQNINVITLGHLYANSLPSLAFNEPALRLGINEVNRIYRGKFNFTLTVLTNPNIKTCLQMIDEGADLISRWYYSKNFMDKNKPDSNWHLTVIISPG